MSYTESIRAIEIAEAIYHVACERGDVIDEPLAAFNAAKAAHRAAFGSLSKAGGVWA